MLVVVLDGRYRLEQKIQQGSSGTTHRAVRVADGAVVAIKELPIAALPSLKSFELFDREIAVLKQLSHRCIPRWLDDFTAGEGARHARYLVREHVEGKSLDAEMKSRRY